MTAPVLWRAALATDPGLQRVNNEDRVFADPDAGIFLVVDGVGGQAAGETAAEIAVRAITRSLAGASGAAEERVRAAIAAANSEIFESAQSHAEWHGMACVLTLALAQGDRIVVGHVGDSRLYVMSAGKLRKLTSDHSPVGEREDQGEISEREAMADPRRNQVFRDVGSRPRDANDEEFIEVHTFQFRPDTAFLLCSDGLTDTIPSTAIAAILESYDGDPQVISRRLVEAANTAGGKDNISVIFVAGPEFADAALVSARKRHAITRLRENRWKAVFGRAVWLTGGILMGSVLWAFLNRSAPESARTAAGREVTLASTEPHSLAKALTIAQPGETLVVPPGQYVGPLELRDEISVISAKPGAAIIRLDNAAVADAGIAVTARGVHHARLSGFAIVSSGDAALATGILIDGANLEIDEMDISGAADCAIRIMGASAPVVRASNLHDNPGCGVWIGGGSSPRLAGNRIVANGTTLNAPRAGIELHPPAAPLVERNIITGNGLPNIEDTIRTGNVTAEGRP